MSGKFVRASKYRHVHGEPARKDKCYNNVRPLADGDGNYIKANKKFFCYSQQGGGGPVVIHPLKNVTRLDNSPPTLNVHKSKVLDFDWSPFLDNLLATASEDATVKVSLIPEDGLTKDQTDAAASLEGHQKKVAFVHFNPVANNILGSCGYDLSLKIWDIQNQSAVISYDEHPDIIQSFEWNENGSLVATTCKDKNVRIFDPRNSQSVQIGTSLPGVKSAKAVWLDNHQKLAVIGFSVTSVRQYAVYDPRKFEKPLNVTDIDQSAGVMMTYYDPDTSIMYLAGKGDGNIRYFEVVDEEPYIHYLSEFRATEPHKGIAFLPKIAVETKDCEIAIALRLMKDQVQPVSFQVPRKSDLFQADIYPDTYAGVPALTEAEWASGKNAEPIKMPIRDAQAKAGSGSSAPATFVAAKSNAELTKELSEAHERIRQLEAELAALKAK